MMNVGSVYSLLARRPALLSLALPNSGLSSLPSPPYVDGGRSVLCWGQERLPGRKGIRKRLRGRKGLPLKIPSLTCGFLRFSGKRRAWEAAHHPASCGSTIRSSLQLDIAAFSYFRPHPVPLQPFNDQGQGTSHPPLLSTPYLSPGPVDRGGWTLLSAHGWEVAGNSGPP